MIDDLTAARAFYTSRERRPAMRRGINIAPLLPAKLLSLKFKEKNLQQKIGIRLNHFYTTQYSEFCLLVL